MPQNPAPPVFELTHLHFRYPRRDRGSAEAGSSWLLRDVNLAVRPGDRVGIIGDNGAGKSTLLKLALGLRTPTEGSVRVFGEPVRWRHHYPRLGYVGDPAHSGEELGLPTDLTVRELVHCYRALFATSGTPVRTGRLAAVLGVHALPDRQIADLSTGERKRLMMFLALAKNPQLLLMDEPLDGLDVAMRKRAGALLGQFAARSNCAIVYIAHSLAELAAVAGQLYQLSDGALREVAPIEFSVVYDYGAGESRLRQSPGQVEATVADAVREAASAQRGFSMRLWLEGTEAER